MNNPPKWRVFLRLLPSWRDALQHADSGHEAPMFIYDVLFQLTVHIWCTISFHTTPVMEMENAKPQHRDRARGRYEP